MLAVFLLNFAGKFLVLGVSEWTVMQCRFYTSEWLCTQECEKGEVLLGQQTVGINLGRFLLTEKTELDNHSGFS